MGLEKTLASILEMAIEQFSFIWEDLRRQIKRYKEEGNAKWEKKATERFDEIEKTCEAIEAMQAHVDELTETVGEWIK